MRLRRLAFVCAIGASVLAACGNNGLLNGTASPTQSAIRFINGSPDLNTAAGVDIYLNGISGGVTSSLTYMKASTLYYITSAAYTVIVTPKGTSSTTSLSCPISTLAANTRYTVVIAGTVANSTLQCQIFPETVYSLPVGAFQLSFHNASPALGAYSAFAGGNGAGFGTFANSSPPVYNNEAGPIAPFTAPASGSNVVQSATSINALPAGVETAPGLGVYVSKVTDAAGDPNPPAAPNVIATILPSQLQPGFSTVTGSTCDPQNWYPIQTPSPTPTPVSTTAPTPTPTPSPATSVCPATSFLMAVYAVDAPAGSGNVANLVGVTD